MHARQVYTPGLGCPRTPKVNPCGVEPSRCPLEPRGPWDTLLPHAASAARPPGVVDSWVRTRHSQSHPSQRPAFGPLLHRAQAQAGSYLRVPPPVPAAFHGTGTPWAAAATQRERAPRPGPPSAPWSTPWPLTVTAGADLSRNRNRRTHARPLATRLLTDGVARGTRCARRSESSRSSRGATGLTPPFTLKTAPPALGSSTASHAFRHPIRFPPYR